MLHREALMSKNMSEELQSILQAVFRDVNYAKNSPLEERLFEKLCDDMEAEHAALLYCCVHSWLFVPVFFTRYF
jgi:hypothetical protein